MTDKPRMKAQCDRIKELERLRAEPKCLLCGELMPPGEEIFNYHGYSGPCPKRMETSCESENLVKELARITAERDAFVAAVKDYRQHFEVDPFSPDAALSADIAIDEALGEET